MADIPAIRITARDEASAVIAGVGTSLNNFAAVAKQTAGALGAVLSVDAITSWAKGTIEAAASLQKLSDVTGSSVENLSRLQNQARVSGVEFDRVQTVLGRMAVSMSSTDQQGQRLAKAFEYLGITAKDPAQALQLFAQRVTELGDATSKAALARDALGRGGEQYLSMLQDMARAQAASATVTKDQAEAAKKLEEMMLKLQTESRTFANILLNDVVPALNQTLTSFNAARQAGFGFWDSLKVAGNWTPDTLVSEIKKTWQELDRLYSVMKKGADQGMKDGDPRLSATQRQIDYLQKYLKMLQAVQGAQAEGEPGGGGPFWTPRRKPYVGGTTGQLSESPYRNLVADLERAAAAVDGLTQVEKIGIEIEKNYADIKQTKLTPAEKTNLLVRAEAIDVYKDQVDYNRQLAEAESKQRQEMQRTNVELARQNEQYTDFIAHLDAEQKAREQQFAALQLSTAEQAALNAGLAMEEKLYSELLVLVRQYRVAEAEGNETIMADVQTRMAALADEWDLRVAGAKASAKAYDGMLTSLRAMEGVFNDLLRIGEDFFYDLFTKGSNAFKNLWENFKRWALEAIAKIAAQQILISVGLSVGGLPGSAAANVAASAGGIGNAIPGVGALFSTITNPLNWGLGIGEGISSMLGGTSLMGGSMIGSTIGLVAPYLLPIALAISMIPGLFGKKGGPKTEGYYATGNVNLSGTGYTDNGRWMTGTGQDAAIKQILDPLQQSYANLAKSLNLTSQATFALGYSQDKLGSAMSNVHSGVWINGQLVYNNPNPNVGRSDEEVQAALSLEVKRMLVAAVKASDLPASLAGLFRDIVPATMTADAADSLLQFAQAYLSLYDAFNSSPLDDALKAVQEAAEGAQGALNNQADALEKLLDTYDGTAQATTDLTTATQDYYKNTVALIAQIEQMKTQLGDMFKSSIKQYTFAGLDTAGQYQYLQQEAASLTGELAASTNADRINALAQMIDADMREAFGLLTPDQQKQMATEFIKGANETSALAAERLAKAQQAAEDRWQEIATDIKTAIDSAAQKFASGGSDVLEGGQSLLHGADEILTAAQLIANASVSSLVTG